MSKLIINSTEVELPASISFTLNNDMLCDEMSYSLQFSLPETENTRLAFRYINKPETRDRNIFYEAYFLFRTLYLKGTVTATYSKGVFNCYFNLNGYYYSKVKDLKLKDVPFETFDIYNENEAHTVAELETLCKNFVSEHNVLDENTSVVFPMLFNPNITNNFEIETNTIGQINFPSVDNKIILRSDVPTVPCFMLKWLYRKLFTLYGLKVLEHPFESVNDIRKVSLSGLMILGNYVVNKYGFNPIVSAISEGGIIASIAEGENPEVECLSAHGLETGDYVMITGTNVPEGKYYQAEKTDNYKFNLTGCKTTSEWSKPVFTLATWQAHDDGKESWVTFNETRTVNYPRYALFYQNIFICNAIATYLGSYIVIMIDPQSNTTFRFTESVNHNAIQLRAMTSNNRYEDGTFVYCEYIKKVNPQMDLTFPRIEPGKSMPNQTVFEFKKAMQANFGLVSFVRFDNTVKITTLKEILLSPDFIDISAFAETVYLESDESDGYTISFVTDSSDAWYAKRVPITSLEGYNYKGEVTYVSQVLNIASKSNDCVFVTSEKAYYVVKRKYLNNEQNVEFLTSDLIEVKNGNGKNKVTIEASPVLMNDVLKNISEEGTHMPYMEVAGNSDIFQSERTEIMPRLLNYHGEWSASSDNVSFNHSPITNNFPNLSLIGDNGLIETLLKETLHWKRIPGKCMIYWPDYLITNFDFSKKYRIHGTDYIIKSIPTKMDCVKDVYVWSETDVVKV